MLDHCVMGSDLDSTELFECTIDGAIANVRPGITLKVDISKQLTSPMIPDVMIQAQGSIKEWSKEICQRVHHNVIGYESEASDIGV